MEAARALDDLKDVSAQVEAAAILDAAGNVVAATVPGDRADELAACVRALLEACDSVREDGTLRQVVALTRAGGVFAVREGEAVVAATTSAQPMVGLVFYDLKSCLHGLRQRAEADVRA